MKSPTPLSTRIKFSASVVFAAMVALTAFVWPLFLACTPAQRSVVRSVVDATEKECPDAMTVDECLRRLGLALGPTAAPSASPTSLASALPTAAATAMVAP